MTQKLVKSDSKETKTVQKVTLESLGREPESSF